MYDLHYDQQVDNTIFKNEFIYDGGKICYKPHTIFEVVYSTHDMHS